MMTRPLTFVVVATSVILSWAAGCSSNDDRIGYVAPPQDPPLGPNGRDASIEAGPDAGLCAATECPAPYATCDTSIYRCDKNLDRDSNNCGGCGIKCPGGEDTTVEEVLHADWRCGSGTCQMSCRQGFIDCNDKPGDGCEVNAFCDPENCGGCGVKCGDGVQCINGACGCPSGLTQCGESFCSNMPAHVCKDLLSDSANCGTCGKQCPQPDVRPPHTVMGCQDGECGHLECETGYDDCNNKIEVDGCEVALGSDPNNCGGCGFKCDPGQRCYAGECICPPGAQLCETGTAPDIVPYCSYVDVDPNNCGACGRRCPPDPTDSKGRPGPCRDGRCITECPANFADCDNNTRNGCETATDSDPNNCGGCGVKCDIAAGQPCIRGQCALAPCPERPVQ